MSLKQRITGAVAVLRGASIPEPQYVITKKYNYLLDLYLSNQIC